MIQKSPNLFKISLFSSKIFFAIEMVAVLYSLDSQNSLLSSSFSFEAIHFTPEIVKQGRKADMHDGPHPFALESISLIVCITGAYNRSDAVFASCIRMTLERIGSAEIDEVVDFKRLLDGVDDDLFHFGELIVNVIVFRDISFEFIRIFFHENPKRGYYKIES